MHARRPSRGAPRRVATLSVHTSPLDQPGAGDAGGMNVYIVEVSRRLAGRGIAVDIFTRATSSDLPPVVEMAPGVTVRHVSAGPFEGLGKEELPAQLCAFTSAVLREEARRLAEKTVGDISLRELSDRLGLAKSNVLRYFDSREAIFLEVLDEEFAMWLSDIEDGLGRPTERPAGRRRHRGGRLRVTP